MNNIYLIGLIGPIGSGKSVVRQMLEQLGAFGIDADLLARVVMRRGNPVWVGVVDTFGVDMLKFDGRIDRRKLGAHVFANPAALQKLEALVHPAVRTLTKDLLRANEKRIVVIEAIKLVEVGMFAWCDALWAVDCVPAMQIERLVRTRQLSQAEAHARIAAQGSFEEKRRLATLVIENSNNLNVTRAQVEKAWHAIQPDTARDKSEWLASLPLAEAPAPVIETLAQPTEPTLLSAPDWARDRPVVRDALPAPATPMPDWAKSRAEIIVRRSRRGDLDALAVALGKKENRATPLTREQTLKRFGERGYRIAVAENRIVALAAWEAENLVASVREMWTESAEIAQAALPQMFELIEREARGLLCEVIVLLIPSDAPVDLAVQAHVAGYTIQDFDALHKLWRQALQDRMQAGDQLWGKILRAELLTKPF